MPLVPLTSTTTASSPKSRLKRSLACARSDDPDTSVSTPVCGSRRSASTAPPRASTPTTTSTRVGRLVTARASEPKKSLLTSRSLGSRDRLQLREAAGLTDQTAQGRLLAAGRRDDPVRGVRELLDQTAEVGVQQGVARGRPQERGGPGVGAQVAAESGQPLRQLLVRAGLGVRVRAVAGQALLVGGQDLWADRVGGAQVVDQLAAVGARVRGLRGAGGVAQQGGDLALVQAQVVERRLQRAQLGLNRASSGRLSSRMPSSAGSPLP